MKKTDRIKNAGKAKNTDKRFQKNALSLGLCAALGLSALCGCSGEPDLTGGVRKISGAPDNGSAQGGTQAGSSAQDDTQAGGSLSGDGSSAQSGTQSGGSAQDSVTPADASTITDFALRLFQESLSQEQAKGAEKNVLVSPVSILFALSMTANGAKGQTLAQLEGVLGASVPALNTYLHEYRTSLPEGDGYRLSMANSIWIRDDERFTVNTDFLTLNEKWYNADIYRAPFDGSTVQAVNKWVSEATDKMIPEILKEIPADAVMYLINGLAFDAEWSTVYKKNDVRKADFTEEDGTAYQTELMYSTEYLYLQDEYAQGFLKYYKDNKYAFAAMLPNEGVSIADYVASLDGETLHDMLSNPVPASVAVAIPKYESFVELVEFKRA